MIQYKQFLKPTILFAAGSFAGVAHAQVTHLDLDYTSSDEGTLVALGVDPGQAQFTFTHSLMTFETPKDTSTIYANSGSQIFYEGTESFVPYSDGSYPYNTQVKSQGVDASGQGYYGVQFLIGDETEYGYLTVDNGGSHISAADFTANPGLTPVVENPGNVPEPAIWAEMILGFGLAGAAMRRRQSAPATA